MDPGVWGAGWEMAALVQAWGSGLRLHLRLFASKMCSQSLACHPSDHTNNRKESGASQRWKPPGACGP